MRPLALALGITFVITCPVLARVPAMSEAWIDHAPTAAQVLRDIKGTDEIDIKARQAAAFDVLTSAIQEWEGALDWRNMSPRAAAKQREYLKAGDQVRSSVTYDDKTCQGHACIRWRFVTGRSTYETNLGFVREVLGRYFPPEYVTAEINWKTTGRIDGVRLPNPNAAPAVLTATEDTSTAIQKSRTGLFPWEKQLPSVAQIKADTGRWDRREQAIVREATLSALLDDVYRREVAEGSSYNAPPQVREKIAAYAKAIGEAYDSACAPGQSCPQGILSDEERLRHDPAFKQHVATLYFGTLQERALARLSGFASALGRMAWPLVGLGVLGLFIWLLFRRRSGNPGPPLSGNFGTARFAALQPWPSSATATAEGVFLGKSSAPEWRNAGLIGPGAPVVTTPENHTLIVARTRTGKGTRVIVPTLLRYAGNAFVIDPKGENAAITARTRRDTLKQTVHVLNPWGLMTGLYAGYGFPPATYNPLDILQRDDPNAVAIARRLASAISPVTGRGDDAFWQQSAANILAAVFLWLTDQPGETKTLARAREIVTLDRKRFTEQFLVKMATSSAFDGAIREITGNLLDLADNTYTGINANLALATAFISDPQLKRGTNSSTFSMADLRNRATTLYLVIPPDQVETQRTWLRLMIAAGMHSFRGKVSSASARRCMMLIDEFPALGKLQDLPSDIATMAGYGLDFTLVVQGLDQLKATYDKESGAILSNCAYKWFCNVTDLEGAKQLSEILGEATVRTVNKSTSFGTSGGGHSTSGQSTTFGEKGRRLLTPDEIINLGRDVAIALRPDGLAMYLKPIDYWNLTTAFGHLVNSIPNYPALYWLPPLTWDDNPYFKKQAPPGGSGQKSGSGSESKSGSKSEQKERAEPPLRAKGRMTESEAREILGVTADATADAIRAAYKRLMLKVHPDAGGTTYFARQLNEARAVLLGK
jgi:type IV secretory pathway TraG/TraD family ATPase VirD4